MITKTGITRLKESAPDLQFVEHSAASIDETTFHAAQPQTF